MKIYPWRSIDLDRVDDIQFHRLQSRTIIDLLELLELSTPSIPSPFSARVMNIARNRISSSFKSFREGFVSLALIESVLVMVCGGYCSNAKKFNKLIVQATLE